MDIKIEGVAEVCDWFASAPAALVDVAVTTGLHAAGSVIEQAIDESAALHTREVRIGGDSAYQSMITGLDVRVTLDEGHRGGRAEVGFFGQPQASVANWVEFGHREVGHKPGEKPLGDVPEQPFMRPAADAVEEDAIDAFVEAVDGAVKQFQEAA